MNLTSSLTNIFLHIFFNIVCLMASLINISFNIISNSINYPVIRSSLLLLSTSGYRIEIYLNQCFFCKSTLKRNGRHQSSKANPKGFARLSAASAPGKQNNRGPLMTNVNELSLEQLTKMNKSVTPMPSPFVLFQDEEPPSYGKFTVEKPRTPFYNIAPENDIKFPQRHPTLYKLLTGAVLVGTIAAATVLGAYLNNKDARDAHKEYVKAPINRTTYPTEADFEKNFAADLYNEIDLAIRKRVPEGLTTEAMAARQEVYNGLVTIKTKSNGEVDVYFPNLPGTDEELGYKGNERKLP